MNELVFQLEHLITQVPTRLKKLNTLALEAKKDSATWSKKEVLGHLIDSGLHNLQRFTYAQFQPLEIQPYPQVELVKVNAYQKQDLQQLLNLWISVNTQIAVLVKNLTEEQLATRIVNKGASFENPTETGITLQWLIEDYVKHLEHHLAQLFGALWPFVNTSETALLATSHIAAIEKLAQVPQTFVTLFEHGSMFVELYKPEEIDKQSPHDQDELYIIIQGNGKFELEGKQQTFQAHDVLFAPAGCQHRFVDFSEDFQTWVIFYGPKGGEGKKLVPQKKQHWKKEGIELHDDTTVFDINYIHHFLSNSYWAKGRSIDLIKQSIEKAHSFGLFEGSKQIGLVRVITDYSTFAYLSDVFVDSKYRGKGLGKWMVNCIIEATLFASCKWMLKTLDAQKLYAQLGFSTGSSPFEVMEK